MYILMIIRGIPSSTHPQWGCFEYDQAQALAKLGHKVVTMSLDTRFKSKRGKFGMTRTEKNNVISYNNVTIPTKLIIPFLGKESYTKKVKYKILGKLLNKIIEEEGVPDVIYSQFFFNTAFAVSIKDKINIPVVGIEHLARFNESTLSKFDEELASFAFNGSDKLIAVADTLAQNIKKRFGKDCEVVHNMYGPEFGNMTVFPKWDKKKPLVFITVGSLIYRKGFDMLIKAFSKANIPSDKWELRIIGWGEEKENLEKLIADTGLSENIKLLGKKDKKEIAEELSRSNVFILPSRNENFSVAILEGLAMGLPVIATDCGGIRECLSKENGVITPVDDVEQMATAINNMMENYDKYDREAIAKDCRERFSPEAIASKLIKVFESVLKNN
ncbi:MAG: glycosyltransferase family 4 protein [Muribaculaceae bacterium]|nr:glycosyltransferase family 4 protein [Muribaculaceae bacterium]